MKSILRHELRWALPAAGLGVLAHLAVLIDAGADNIWFLPTQKWSLSLNFYLVAPMLLALVTTWGDDLLHTREYRAHRPISARALFWARHLLALAVLLIWVVLPLALHLLGTVLFSKDAALIDASRFGMHAAFGAAAPIFYALGVFCGALCRTLLGALLLAATQAISTGLLIFVHVILYPTATLVVLPVAALVLTPLLLLVGQRAEEQGRDLDLPWRPRTVRMAGPLVVVLATVTALVGTSGWEMGAGKLLLEHYPQVTSDGHQLFLQRYQRADHREHQVDEQHRDVGLASDAWVTVYDPDHGPWRSLEIPGLRDSFPQRGMRFRGQLLRRIMAYLGEETMIGYLGEDGYLHVFRRARFDGRGDDRVWQRPVGKGGDGPFAERDRVVSDGGVLAIRDGQDGSLWLLEPGEGAPRFAHHALPDGDRLLGVNTPPYRPWLPGTPNPRPTIFIGERGAYVLEGGQLRSSPARPELLASARAQPRVRIDGPDSFTVELNGPTAAFVHHYRPHTLPERALAVLLRLPSVLRPPLLALPSAAFEAERLFTRRVLALDWGIAAGDRLALGANVALALILTALTFRRLRRLALPRGRRLWWTAAVLFTGLPAYLCQRLVETERAWRAMPAVADRAEVKVLVFKAA